MKLHDMLTILINDLHIHKNIMYVYHRKCHNLFASDQQLDSEVQELQNSVSELNKQQVSTKGIYNLELLAVHVYMSLACTLYQRSFIDTVIFSKCYQAAEVKNFQQLKTYNAELSSKKVGLSSFAATCMYFIYLIIRYD